MVLDYAKSVTFSSHITTVNTCGMKFFFSDLDQMYFVVVERNVIKSQINQNLVNNIFKIT